MRSRPIKIETLLLAACLLGAVGAASCSSWEQGSKARIYGGLPAPAGTFPAVVAVVAPDYGRVSCSGTLIAPDVVLTAGHCLRSASGDLMDPLGAALRPAADLAVHLGDGDDAEPLRAQYGVKALAVHPLLRAGPNGYADFGLLQLDREVPDVTPLRLITDLASQLEGLRQGRVTLVGFGRTEAGIVGRKGLVTTHVQSYTGAEAVVGGGGEDSCTGDSGGPALITGADGSFSVLGIVSRGVHLGCGDGTTIGLSSEAACWLSQQQAVSRWSDLQAYLAQSCDKPTHVYSDSELDDADFVRLCEAQTGDAAQRHTIAAIMLASRAPTCFEAARWLNSSNRLVLDGLMLEDLSPLSQLAHVVSLSLKANRISDVSPLRRLVNLRRLEVEGNNIRDTSALDHLVTGGLRIKGLKRQSWNHQNTEFRRQCMLMRGGLVSTTTERTIRALLWHASADDCDMANARLLGRTSLNLSGRLLSELRPLADFTGLQQLDLSDNPIIDVTPLSQLENLRHLDLRRTSVSNLEPLAELLGDGLELKR